MSESSSNLIGRYTIELRSCMVVSRKWRRPEGQHTVWLSIHDTGLELTKVRSRAPQSTSQSHMRSSESHAAWRDDEMNRSSEYANPCELWYDSDKQSELWAVGISLSCRGEPCIRAVQLVMMLFHGVAKPKRPSSGERSVTYSQRRASHKASKYRRIRRFGLSQVVV